MPDSQAYLGRSTLLILGSTTRDVDSPLTVLDPLSISMADVTPIAAVDRSNGKRPFRVGSRPSQGSGRRNSASKRVDLAFIAPDDGRKRHGQSHSRRHRWIDRG